MRINFGHIPKCGGTKIKKTFSTVKGFKGYKHKQRVCCKDGYRFASIRHPLDWYVSLWAYKSSGTKYTFEDRDFETLLKDHLIDVHRRKRWWKPNSKWFYKFLKFTDVDIGILSMMFIHQAFIDWEEILRSKDVIGTVLSKSSFDLDRVIKTENLNEGMREVLNDISYEKINELDLNSIVNYSRHDNPDVYYSPFFRDLVLKKERLIVDLFYKEN